MTRATPGIVMETIERMIMKERSSSWLQINWTRRARRKLTALYCVKFSLLFLRKDATDFSKSDES